MICTHLIMLVEGSTLMAIQKCTETDEVMPPKEPYKDPLITLLKS